MNRKPSKVQEPTAACAVKKTSKAGAAVSADNKPVRYVDPAAARKLTKEIMDKHQDLFRRLAQ